MSLVISFCSLSLVDDTDDGIWSNSDKACKDYSEEASRKRCITIFGYEGL